jgi:hypothetical protein
VKEINLITDKINKMSLVEDVQAESPQQQKEVLDQKTKDLVMAQMQDSIISTAQNTVH